jgi:hypothetical protein
MKVVKEVIIENNIEAIWEVMGNQFGDVHLWSSNFLESRPAGESVFQGLEYSTRVTVTERGETIQELDEFNTANHSLSYHITKGAPEVVEKASAVWSLSPKETNSTKAIFEFSMKVKDVVNEAMASKIKSGLMLAATEMAEELKYYMENGKPHARKAAQLTDVSN